MLRSILVVTLLAIGGYYALQTPFYALLFYLGYGYFKPELWLWTNFMPPKFGFFLGAYVVLVTLAYQPHFIMNRRIAIIFIFLFHNFFSMLFTDYSTNDWGALINLFKIIIMMYVIVILTTDFARFRSIFLVLVVFLGIEGAKQGWFYLITSPGWGENPNRIYFLGDNNCVAVGMLMVVPVVALLAQTTQRRWACYGYWFLLVGVLFRALSTHSRGGFLAALALGTVYWLRSQRKLRVLLGIGVIVAIVLPALPEAFWGRMRTIQTYEEEEEASAISRLHFWRVAVAMANANPLLGVGHFRYNAAYNDYDFLDGQYGQNRSVHSSFFGVLAELGYLGFVLYIYILYAAWRGCHRVRKLVAQQPQLVALSQSATALETSLVVFMVGGSFIPFQYNDFLWQYIGFSIALEEIARRHVTASAEEPWPDLEVVEATVATKDERA